MVFYLNIKSGGTDSLDIDFEVSRTKLTVDPDTVLSKCSLSAANQGCTLNVPLSYSVGLVALHATDSTDWSNGISVSTVCNARVWVYVLISIGCVIAAIVFVVGIIASCIICKRYEKMQSALKKGNQPTPMVEQDPAPAPTTTTYITENQAPPPYNPSYGDTSQPAPKFY